MATVVLVPMVFSPAGTSSPPTEVSVAAALPNEELVPDDLAFAGPDGFGVDVDIDVDVPPPAPTTTTPPPETTTTTVEVSTTTTVPPERTTKPAPPPTTATEATDAEVATTAHNHPPPPPPPDTTTTAPPPPPPPPTTHTHPEPAAPADDDVRAQEGQASWYDLPGSRAGVCAHRTIAKGTVVRVTNLDTGKSITCTVDDRGPYADGKIIDLYRDDFARLAPLSQGVFPTRITW